MYVTVSLLKMKWILQCVVFIFPENRAESKKENQGYKSNWTNQKGNAVKLKKG
jgi:hypothetical protein